MKVDEIMTRDPMCCTPEDSAQQVASMLCREDVGSLPVVRDQTSRKLVGMITDRDLCCTVVAEGLNSAKTVIDGLYTENPVACHVGDDLEGCERMMQERQIRRIPILDDEGRVVGIISQADLALKTQPEQVYKTVAEISKPASEPPSVAA